MKNNFKINFGRGAMSADPQDVFNAGSKGNAICDIDLAEGQMVDPAAFKALVQAAAADQAAKRLGS